MPDFLTSTKPSVMVRNAPWPKSPTMSTSDAISTITILCTKVCFKFLSVMALRFPLGLYLSSISSSASYKQLAQLCCQWKLVNNSIKTTFKAVPLFYKREWHHCSKGLAFIFPSNQYYYCSCSFKIFAFELKYWPCWPNNNSFKDTEVKLAALHMYFEMLTSTCTVSCAVHI